MTNTQKFISDALLETCLDTRIDDGIINLTNYDHTQVLAEYLYGKGIDLSLVVEIINNVVAREGKFPERQAYNKEGWLVTFPSTEYKSAAIKRGTHFASDPTHGKGGMNIYYKRKGKQKRMVRQEPSSVEPSQTNATTPIQTNNPTPDPSVASTPTPESPPVAAPNSTGSSSLPKSGDAPEKSNGAGPAAEPDEDEPESSPTGNSSSGTSNRTQSGNGENKPDQSSIKQTMPHPAPPSFVNISVDFAKIKQWNPTPYGEWRNAMGETTAIVALSGEVVPIKTTDREELKLFAAKKQPQ